MLDDLVKRFQFKNCIVEPVHSKVIRLYYPGIWLLIYSRSHIPPDVLLSCAGSSCLAFCRSVLASFFSLSGSIIALRQNKFFFVLEIAEYVLYGSFSLVFDFHGHCKSGIQPGVISSWRTLSSLISLESIALVII